MLVTTHAAVAMAITAATKNPAIYLPLALLNHPVLDMVPHFGFSREMYPVLREKLMLPMVATDVVFGTTVFFLILERTGLPFWLLFGVCLLAGWPDILALYQRKTGRLPKVLELHERIQTESPWFLIWEILIVSVCLAVIFKN